MHGIFTNNQNQQPKKDRFKLLKDRQNEERQKKLEEIKAQAFAAQRFREEKDAERRRRIDDLRGREDVRRLQVEERKRAIEQAEQDRLVSILRRNQERESRIESRRRGDRSSAAFAFGSSTPRMLDPSDMSASYWGHRRAASIQNIASASAAGLTRRQSERDLDGSKKRATSASGLERSGENSAPLTPAGCVSGYVGRRRTDLMPTIPSRDASFAASSRKSLNHSPGRAYSMSRLDQLAKPRKRQDLPLVLELTTKTSSTLRPLSTSPKKSSITRSMSHLAVGKTTTTTHTRKLNKNDSRSMHQLVMDPIISPRTTRATQLRQSKLQSSNSNDASSRPSSSLSQQSTTSVTSSVSVRHRPSTAPRRQRPASIAITGISQDIMTRSLDISRKVDYNKPPLPKTRKTISKDNKMIYKTNSKSPVDSTPKSLQSPVSINEASIDIEKVNGVKQEKFDEKKVVDNGNVEEIQKKLVEIKVEANTGEIEKKKEDTKEEIKEEKKEEVKIEKNEEIKDERNEEIKVEKKEEIIEECPKNENIIEAKTEAEPPNLADIKQITTNLIKAESAPLAEQAPEPEAPEVGETTASIKVRINTEEEAKAALAERRRLIREEAERQAEMERARAEAEAAAEGERQRREEEQIQQLVLEQRAQERDRLEEAIRETQRRAEEERVRTEEELRSKLAKEEAERRAREEAEKKMAEQAERIKNEEKEREARRKRVEAIMKRTRTSNANSPSQNSEDKNENKSENKINGTKPVQQENGTNGKDDEVVDNRIPDETIKNANTVSIDTINSTDSINSNNSWQATQQYDSLM